MKLHLLRDRDEGHPEAHQIWVSLDETTIEQLENARESFILASGRTQSEAMIAAANELTTLAAALLTAVQAGLA